MRVQEGRIPIKIWAESVEDGAMEQARHLSELPFAFRHIALMPDVHQGYGMPIGGVMATKGVIVPSAVGLDIGCGMRAWQTSATIMEFREKEKSIMEGIRRIVPVGFNWHNAPGKTWDPVLSEHTPVPVIDSQYERSKLQLGTLGGGNHFIEAQADATGSVHFMIHSGSRNLGKTVAEHYNKIAKELSRKWFSSVPVEWDLAFLPMDSEEGREYLDEMNGCLAFALLNRQAMMEAVNLVLLENGISPVLASLDVHHNYAVMENHFGVNVMVHRKGAVRARAGDWVIVPGSMGSSSFIGEGLGERESFESCSHGAGRAMGRNQAKKTVTKDEVVLEMAGKGVSIYKAKMDDVAEECRQAYKDINAVMAQQGDLVQIMTELFPLAVIKA